MDVNRLNSYSKWSFIFGTENIFDKNGHTKSSAKLHKKSFYNVMIFVFGAIIEQKKHSSNGTEKRQKWLWWSNPHIGWLAKLNKTMLEIESFLFIEGSEKVFAEIVESKIKNALQFNWVRVGFYDVWLCLLKCNAFISLYCVRNMHPYWYLFTFLSLSFTLNFFHIRSFFRRTFDSFLHLCFIFFSKII